MSDPIVMRSTSRRLAMHPGWLVVLFSCAALVLSLHQLDALLPRALWWQALFAPDMADMRQIVVHESVLPRLFACLLSGAQLSLAGAIFQQVLRNPLAEPTTLGVSAGASLASSLTLLFAPQWLFVGQQWVALSGAAMAMLIVVGLAWRRRLSPIALILAGLIVNFYCGSINAVLTLFHHDDLQSLFIWGAGSLNQNNWDVPHALFPRLLIGCVCAAALVRPLTMMSLADESARGLGVSLRFVRFASLVLAVFLGASVVASVGVIGFLGVLGPMIVRLAGARRFQERLIWAPLFGAALLWFTDQLVQMLTGAWAGVPTGAVMSLIGAPLLFWLLPRLPALPDVIDMSMQSSSSRHFRWLPAVLLACLVLLAVMGMGLFFGKSANGWHLATLNEMQTVLHWRGPRLFAALAAGALLGLAGAIMQRVTGNSMASPEVLGISAGASLGLIAVLFALPDAGRIVQTSAAGGGAFVTLLAMLALGRRYGFAPERMLLVGVTLGTAFSALVAVLLASNDPRMSGLLAWMAGSTYGVSASDAVTAVVAVGVLGVSAAVLVRWLDVLPLGEAVSVALGINLRSSRLCLLLLAALMTGVATIVVGPLSFIGLMAPHLARMLGLRRAAAQLAGAALLGAFILVLADWIGRNIVYPFQIPVGLLATLLGGLYFMWLMVRGRAAI